MAREAMMRWLFWSVLVPMMGAVALFALLAVLSSI